MDAFVIVYFFSNTDLTAGNVVASPSIMMMDNLYLVSIVDGSNKYLFSDSTSFFSPQSVYINYDVAGSPKLETNDGEFSPSVMHFHGAFDTNDTDSIKLKIFFDFIEPLTKSEDS